MGAEILRAAHDSTSSVLANVTPEQMSGSTPCASWSVLDVVNHVVGGSHYMAHAMETGQAPDGYPEFDQADYLASYQQGAERSVLAFDAPGALDKDVVLPFGTMPGSAVLNLAALDTFTHGWDLAKATGQSTDLDPVLAANLLEVAKQTVPDGFRGDDGVMPFAPAVLDAKPTCPADELAAFLGRDIL